MPKIILAFLLCFWVVPQLVFAQGTPATDPDDPLKFQKEIAEKAGFDTTQQASNFYTYLSIIVKAALTLVGVLFFAYMFYGGYLWFTAAGNEEQVKRAQEAIRHAVIGLVITIGAYSITAFVLSKLL
jgi:hypothetical protein